MFITEDCVDIIEYLSSDNPTESIILTRPDTSYLAELLDCAQDKGYTFEIESDKHVTDSLMTMKLNRRVVLKKKSEDQVTYSDLKATLDNIRKESVKTISSELKHKMEKSSSFSKNRYDEDKYFRLGWDAAVKAMNDALNELGYTS